jgi:hypothetical protein
MLCANGHWSPIVKVLQYPGFAEIGITANPIAKCPAHWLIAFPFYCETCREILNGIEHTGLLCLMIGTGFSSARRKFAAGNMLQFFDWKIFRLFDEILHLFC